MIERISDEMRYAKFLEVLKALEDKQVDYVLVGGYAVILHGSQRTTTDLDIFIRTTDENLHRFREALKSVFNEQSIEEITVSELKEYSVLRFISQEEITIDIISNLGEMFSIDDLVFEDILVDGNMIRVASLETLYKLKQNTYRPIDQEDSLFISEMLKKKLKK
ncbi:MAG: nucleotidyltransferase [Ignavibacteriaceae bacterium]|nr:nucleotidyltransferase [Ignavibacteriaceae bacterium]